MDDIDSPDLGSVYRSDGDGVLVYEVKQVYIYIPSELSATGFELKIAGLVRIVKKVGGVIYNSYSMLFRTHAWIFQEEIWLN